MALEANQTTADTGSTSHKGAKKWLSGHSILDDTCGFSFFSFPNFSRDPLSRRSGKGLVYSQCGLATISMGLQKGGLCIGKSHLVAGRYHT